MLRENERANYVDLIPPSGMNIFECRRWVLLVEDNEMNRDMLGRRLTKRGYVMSYAKDGQHAILTALTERPDLILMDLSLPKIDGWEATRRLKADDRTETIPIVALTAHALTEDRESACDAGCDEFETKPVNIKKLIAKMDALLNVLTLHEIAD